MVLKESIEVTNHGAQKTRLSFSQDIKFLKRPRTLHYFYSAEQINATSAIEIMLEAFDWEQLTFLAKLLRV